MRFICCEAEEDIEPIHVAQVEMDRMPCFSSGVVELKEIILHLWRSSHLTSPLQAQNKDIEHETIILEDKGRKLEPANHTVCIHMRHVLASRDGIVLHSDVIGRIVVQKKTM